MYLLSEKSKLKTQKRILQVSANVHVHLLQNTFFKGSEKYTAHFIVSFGQRNEIGESGVHRGTCLFTLNAVNCLNFHKHGIVLKKRFSSNVPISANLPKCT